MDWRQRLPPELRMQLNGFYLYGVLHLHKGRQSPVTWRNLGTYTERRNYTHLVDILHHSELRLPLPPYSRSKQRPLKHKILVIQMKVIESYFGTEYAVQYFTAKKFSSPNGQVLFRYETYAV
jgi:hypothetical protein